MRWDIITLSLSHQIDPNSIEKDIGHFENVHFPGTKEILVINDASEDVGSGGSALNALIRTTERLCYRNKLTVLTETVLQNVNVLIVLVSDPKAILNSSTPSTSGSAYIFSTYLTESIKNATEIAKKSEEKGIWIIGSDATWHQNPPPTLTLAQDAITGFSFHAPLLEGHGYYSIRDLKLMGMEFQGESSGLKGQKDLLIIGFLYLPYPLATAFLSLYSEFPVAATTYLGVDSNVKPTKLSIFFDFMLATCLSEGEFVENRLGIHGKVAEDEEDRSDARRQIYRKLREFKGRIEVLDIRDYAYKEFPTEIRDYSTLGGRDIERNLRTRLSVNSLAGLSLQKSIKGILESLKNRILTSEDDHLQIIFTASLALSLASQGKGGLRNGPAKNQIFEKLIQKGDLAGIFDEIIQNWVSDPSMMIRAARHLETAAQKIIREMVEGLCASRSLKLQKSSDPSISFARVTAPVRIDFFGGWLDTPPIFFSMEKAAVVNMAIKLDGKNPISCNISKIPQAHIELIQDGSSLLIKSDQDLLHMHDKPSETGALVSACIVALGYRTLSSLFQVLQCHGLRIETHSDLPHGSGLGTSSIMACTIIRGICALAMVPEDYPLEDKIVHTVLRVEQLMTTGGGWQDQFGAVYEGLKTCYYHQDGVYHKPIPLTLEVKEILEQRLLLVYTGKTRLAKNLLQEVIRNFYCCSETQKRLGEMAEAVEEFSRRIKEGDMPIELLERYYATKNFMTRCEPAIVTELLDSLKSLSLILVGWSAGAGGGGFLYLWLTPNTNPNEIQEFLQSSHKFSKMSCHTISIPLVPPVTLEMK